MDDAPSPPSGATLAWQPRFRHGCVCSAVPGTWKLWTSGGGCPRNVEANGQRSRASLERVHPCPAAHEATAWAKRGRDGRTDGARHGARRQTSAEHGNGDRTSKCVRCVALCIAGGAEGRQGLIGRLARASRRYGIMARGYDGFRFAPFVHRAAARRCSRSSSGWPPYAARHVVERRMQP